MIGKNIGWTITKYGYGIASIADSGCYNIVFIYFLFYLTDVAHLNPASASMITSTAILWSGIMTAIVGSISDNTFKRKGRKRSLLNKSIFPLVILISLLFTNFNFPTMYNTLYYLIVAICFWSAYTLFYVPYTALGAEITVDYQKRFELRTTARLFMIVGNVLGIILPLQIVGHASEIGMSDELAWQISALIIGMISGITIAITYISTKGKESEIKIQMTQKKPIIKQHLEVVRIKPYLYILVNAILFIAANTMIYTLMPYYTKYNLKISDTAVSNVFIISIFLSFLFMPLTTAVVRKLGKSQTLYAMMFFSGISMILLFLSKVDTYNEFILFIAIYSLASAAYWQIIFSIIYDVCEVDEFMNGAKREGTILSVFSIINKIAYAAAIQLVGFLLNHFNYNANLLHQSKETLTVIKYSFTLIPALLMLAAATILIFYPITKEKHLMLLQGLELKRMGKTCPFDSLEKIFK